MPIATNSNKIRKQIRQKRRSISNIERKLLANKITSRLIEHKRILNAQKIALTLAFDGEIDTSLFIKWCWKNKKKIYLPVIHPFTKGHLLFLEYTSSTPMIDNQYGISEPKLDITTICPTCELDIIFTPLVAFDTNGNRLGMGAGYYDRTLAPWLKRKKIPYPIGLAFDCQMVETLETQEWDVPLAELITPSTSFKF